MAIKVNPESVTLEWVCNNDWEHTGADDQEIVHQNLSYLVAWGGIAVCPQCGKDMELVSADIDAAVGA